ncbi:hypothetical protein [Gordonia sp. CPCC 205333]|uniref:hypothetical protein n=1 Tax=Gordonia sp. CPCC 205333 TaxID=3140790 RepID=UPI003AF3C170
MTGEQELTRPPQVLWALRLWVTSGALLVAIGVVTIVGTVIVNEGAEAIGIGALEIAIGGGYCFAARKLAIAHDLRVRSSLAVTSLVVVVLLLMAALLSQSPVFAVPLVVALLGLFGSLLAYRPESEAWFAQQDGK